MKIINASNRADSKSLERAIEISIKSEDATSPEICKKGKLFLDFPEHLWKIQFLNILPAFYVLVTGFLTVRDQFFDIR